MKELTIGEKAKRYDEILARANVMDIPYYKDYKGDVMFKVKEFVDYLLPELKENEDERIRKGLIGHLKELKEQSVEGSHLKCPEHYDAWIAWLEKQGEKGVVLRDTFGFEEGREKGREEGIMLVLGNPRKYGLVKGLRNLANSAKTCKDGQNHVWSEEDENHVKSILSTIECCKAQFPNAQVMVEAYNSDIKWLNTLKNRYTWKSSDEQMKSLRNILRYFEMLGAYGESIDGLKELEEQLKKLREG